MAVHVHLLCRNFGANKLHNSSLQKILHVHQLFELILIEMKWFLNCLACHDETTQTCKYAEQENEESEENGRHLHSRDNSHVTHIQHYQGTGCAIFRIQ